MQWRGPRTSRCTYRRNSAKRDSSSWWCSHNVSGAADRERRRPAVHGLMAEALGMVGALTAGALGTAGVLTVGTAGPGPPGVTLGGAGRNTKYSTSAMPSSSTTL